jgi:hypothetical protein
MMRYVAELAPSLKVAMPTLISGFTLGAIDWWVKFESQLPAIASIVAIIGGVIIAASHYCKMVWDNRHARAKARLDEIEIEQEVKDSRLKDLLIREQEIKNSILEKQAVNKSEGKE